ncbi:hypothetical protein EK21DRAFT_113166 [Setomelanomma holmii]|uniref:Uncharacterized protein n=1 Tax=Setomelanomma holmii TaxID=210430 RepID=A0A9P4H9J7_9PLEO|nr:hypothetical protein EK21DRAFT_113166 [Setomelanomma holmii]
MPPRRDSDYTRPLHSFTKAKLQRLLDQRCGNWRKNFPSPTAFNFKTKTRGTKLVPSVHVGWTIAREDELWIELCDVKNTNDQNQLQDPIVQTGSTSVPAGTCATNHPEIYARAQETAPVQRAYLRRMYMGMQLTNQADERMNEVLKVTDSFKGNNAFSRLSKSGSGCPKIWSRKMAALSRFVFVYCDRATHY